jgi:hypothetical protein
VLYFLARGDVAQLGERRVRNAKVGSSILLVSTSASSPVLNATAQRSAIQKRTLFEKVSRHFGVRLCGRSIAVWGLAFKANTDGLR